MNSSYDTLVNAFQSLQGTAAMLDSEGDDDFDRLPEYFDANRPHLDQARAALRQKPTVPLEYHADWLSKSADPRAALRHLACVFGAELRLAAHRRDFARAAELAVDGLDLANGIRRGGIKFDALFSNACMSYLLKLLAQIRREIPPLSRARLIAELARMETERESFESIEVRDKQWEKAVNVQNPQEREIEDLIDELECRGEIFAEENRRGISTEDLRASMREHFQYGKAEARRGASVAEQRVLMKEVYEAERISQSAENRRIQMHQADQVGLCALRMLMVDLKVRAFHQEQGRYPETLAQLARGAEPALPVDPFTGKFFVYRRKSKWSFFRKTEAGFDLYSPGPHSIDRGGQFGSLAEVMAGHADFCLDWSDYQENNGSLTTNR